MDLKKNWLIVGVLILVVALGAFLRFPQLTGPDVWYDEAFTGITVRQDWDTMLRVIKQDRNHPPVFYSLVKVVTQIVGRDDPMALRLVSFIAGLLSIPMIFLVVQRLSGLQDVAKRALGLGLALVLAISPFYVGYSAEARSYAFLLFLMLGSLYFFLGMIRQPFQISFDAVMVVASIVLIYFTHFLSLLIVSGYIVVYAYLIAEKYELTKQKHFWQYVGFGGFGLFMSAVYIWEKFDLQRHIARLNLGWIPSANLSSIPRTLSSFLFGVNRQQLGLPQPNQFSVPWIPENFGFLLVIATIVAIVLVVQKIKQQSQQRELIVLALMGLIPLSVDLLASSFELYMYVDRYVIGYGTFLLLFIGYVWWHLVDERILYGLLLYIGLLFFVTTPAPNKNYSSVVSQLSTIQAPMVVVDSPIDYLVFQYYLNSTELRVKRNPAGYDYNWPYIPASVEQSLSNVPPNSAYIAAKSVPVDTTQWIKVGESNDFALYQKID
jgi:hypothetical protein